MKIQRLITAVQIYKILNEINPLYMKNIFTPKENSKVRQNDITVKGINASRFGTQSLRPFGQKIRNNLLSEISFPKFKEYIKTWLKNM